MALKKAPWCSFFLTSLTCTFIFIFLWQHRSDPDQPVLGVHTPRQYLEDLPGCQAIIRGELEGVEDPFQSLMSSRGKGQRLSEHWFLNATRDCKRYTETRGFVPVPLSAEEADFPIAYSMVIHQQVEMFERLLRAVYRPQNVYCVHVDRGSSRDFRAAVDAIVSCFPNVFVASKLENVVYASWSRVQADLNCMKDLLGSPVRWRYLLNTCGADFPIKTNLETVRVLKQLRGRSSMESEATSEHKKGRWMYRHNVTDTVVRTDSQKAPPPIASPMYSGNAYFVVSRDFVRHVMEDEEVQRLLDWERDTYSPDEHLWATLRRMPAVPGSVPANDKYDESDMLALARLVKWSYLAGDVNRGAPYPPCAGEYRRAVCVYGAGDLRWMLRQHHLLANKFDPEVDDLPIRCLEAHLHHQALLGASPVRSTVVV